MSKFLMALLFCSLSISNNSMAFSDESPSIEVKGQASVLAEPDQFSLTIAIAERGQHTNKIRAIVDHKSNQVIRVAENLGIENNNINSAKVTLRIIEIKPSISVDGVEVTQRLGNKSFPDKQYGKVNVGTIVANNPNKIKPKYFELRRTISINFDRIEDYDQFLNKIIKLGVQHIYPLAMTVENTEKHYQQALIQAFNNAKDKADLISRHSNVELGKLLFVKEQSSNYYRPRVYSAKMSAESTTNHSSQVGSQMINASVLVKFSIQ